MALRDEFRFKCLGFSGLCIDDFSGMRLMCLGPKTILTYRFLVSVYLVTSTVVSICDFDSVEWFKFLTIWSWIISTLYYISITITSAYYYWLNNRKHSYTLPKYFITQPNSKDSKLEVCTPNTQVKWFQNVVHLKFVWILFESSFVVSLLVTAMYWTFIWKPERVGSPILWFLNINEHALNFIFLMIDFFFHQIPVRLLHVVYPFLFGLSYVVFSVVYTKCTEHSIYSILDWKDSPEQAISYAFVSLVLLVIGHGMFFCLDRMKIKWSVCKDVEKISEKVTIV